MQRIIALHPYCVSSRFSRDSSTLVANQSLIQYPTVTDEYFQTWKLKLITAKMVSEIFHVNNKEAKRELKVKYNDETHPKYLGVTLVWSLTHHRLLESFRK